MQADSPDTTTVSPLARASYVMSEPHGSGYRVVLGFDTRDDADAAHEHIARAARPFCTISDEDEACAAAYVPADSASVERT